jgi:hypothetical protein
VKPDFTGDRTTEVAVRWIRLSVIALVTTSCLLSTEPFEDLDISLWLQDSLVVADSGLAIRVSAVNRVGHPVHLSSSCLLGIAITPPAGGELPDEYRGGGPVCTLERPIDLAPGDSITLTRHLGFRPWYTDSAFHDRSRVTRWSAGPYHVTGYLWHAGAAVRRTAPSTFHLVCGDPAWPAC